MCTSPEKIISLAFASRYGSNQPASKTRLNFENLDALCIVIRE